MRSRERSPPADLTRGGRSLPNSSERIAIAADEGRAAIEARRRTRRTAMSCSRRDAVAQEIVRMAARSDITEEVTRFLARAAWVALSDAASRAAGSSFSCRR
jgi:hypothetical protein